MQKLVALLCGLLLGVQFAAVEFRAIAQTILNVGTCVATPSGIFNSKFCADGNDGSFALVWATVPAVQAIEGTTFSVDVCQYLAQPGTPNATITNVGAALPTGWTLSGTNNCTLAYSGTGTGTARPILRATRTAVTQDSNDFQVQSTANASADTTAPTVITGVVVTLNASNQPVLTFDAPADVRVSGQNVSGTSTFTPRRNGTPLTATAFVGTSFTPTFVPGEIGTVASDGQSQSGADWTLTAEGGAPIDGTNFHFLPATLTANLNSITVEIASYTGGSNANRGGGVQVRESSDTGSKFFGCHVFPSGNIRSYSRVGTDGPVAQAGLVAVPALTFPVWLRITRAGDAFICAASTDGNAFSDVNPPSTTVSMAATVLAGPTAQSNQAGTPITVAFQNIAISTRARQSYTDTGGTAGSSSYTLTNIDVATNIAAASAAVVAPAAPVTSGRYSTPYTDPLNNVTLQGGRVTTSITSSGSGAGGMTTELADQDCGETLSVANGVTVASSRSITANCVNTNPFIVKCASPGQCTFTGDWTFTEASANAILRDVLFSGTSARVTCDGDTNHVINNEFTGWNGVAVSPRNNDGRGRNCEIAYTEFHDHGAYAAKTYTYNPPGCVFGVDDPCTRTLVTQIRMGVRTNDDGVSDFHTGGWYHHNYFHDFEAKEEPTVYNSSQNDGLEIGETEGGTYPQINARTWIETTLIANHFQGGSDAGVCGGSAVGAAILDLKVGGVTVYDVTLDHVCGNVDARGGSQNGRTIESVYYDDDSVSSMGIRGTNVNVIGNRVRGPLNIAAGQLACTAPTAADDANGPNNYPATCNTLIVGNNVSGTTVIGHRYGGNDRSWTFPASSPTLRAHTGGVTGYSPVLNNCPPAISTPPPVAAAPCVTGASINTAAAAGITYTFARKLVPADVGRAKFPTAPAAYCAARGGC